MDYLIYKDQGASFIFFMSLKSLKLKVQYLNIQSLKISLHIEGESVVLSASYFNSTRIYRFHTLKYIVV